MGGNRVRNHAFLLTILAAPPARRCCGATTLGLLAMLELKRTRCQIQVFPRKRRGEEELEEVRRKRHGSFPEAVRGPMPLRSVEEE